MIWLYVSWLVLLIGASIAFYYQNPQYLIAKPDKLILSNRMREKIALLIMRAIGGAIYNDEPPLNADDLAGRVSAPNEALERVLGALEQARLIKQTNDDPPAYLPAKPLETTQLKSVLDAVRMAGESAGFNVDRLPGSPMIDAVMGDLDAAAVKALEGRTVKQLAVARTVDVGDPESIAPLVISKS